MPIYHYRCKDCKHEFKELQKYKEKVETLLNGSCPKCGKKSLQEKMSSPCFHLKGTGWHYDGYT